jgi:branched-chain amino acid transport system substrate-binding protein
MARRAVLASALAVVVGLTATAVALARSERPSRAAASCGTFTIGMLAPITGPAASIGSDQLHWAQFYVTQWNKNPKAAFKLRLLQGDTQLDPSKASTVAQQFASNKRVLGVIGPAGSQEVIATAPIFKRAGLAFISGSATRVDLTNGKWRGYFFRVVPNDGVQGPSDADYMTAKLGVKSGDSVMVVDDQEAYSTGLADIVQKTLTAKGVKVDRESISQKDTDFSSLVAKVTPSTKVVFTPFQLSSQTQLLAQQLKAQGKKAVVFASDGSFDVAKFNVDGSFVSFFAPDVTTVPANAAIVRLFHKQFPGATSPFGAPNYVAAQVYATALSSLCAKHAKVTRASLRAAVARVKLRSTLIGPISFTRNGDVAGAKFHIFKVTGGKYVTVS